MIFYLHLAPVIAFITGVALHRDMARADLRARTRSGRPS